MGQRKDPPRVGVVERDDLNQILSKTLNRRMTSRAAQRGAVNAEEYWPDREGLDHRDTVTDFTRPEGTFFDVAMVHLLAAATLDRLRELYPQGRFELHARYLPKLPADAPRRHRT